LVMCSLFVYSSGGLFWAWVSGVVLMVRVPLV